MSPEHNHSHVPKHQGTLILSLLLTGGFMFAEIVGGMLSGSLALLCALGPAMWHMWIYLGSANANFFYAITLLFGGWQV